VVRDVQGLQSRESIIIIVLLDCTVKTLVSSIFVIFAVHRPHHTTVART